MTPHEQHPAPKRDPLKRYKTVPFRPVTNRVDLSFTVRVDFEEIVRLFNHQQMQAFMRGIAEVISAQEGNHAD